MSRNRFSAYLAVCIAIFSFHVIADYPPKETIQDGKTFEGRLKVATGFWRWVGSNEKLQFLDGKMIWDSGEGSGYQPGKYTIEQLDGGRIAFNAKVVGMDGDTMVWHGYYDGKKLTKVKAVWTREQENFFYDLILPKKIHWIFTQNKDQ